MPKAIGRLIDTLSNHLEIKNDLSRAKTAAEVAKIEAQSANDVRAMEANADHALKLFEKEAAADRARAWDELQSERRQRNRENVLEKAVQELKGTPDSEVTDGKQVDPDWTAQFFNHVQDVSNDEMQSLWAKLLSGEIKRPGSFGTRTLEKVRTLSKSDAEVFTRLCSVAWKAGTAVNAKLWALTDPAWVHAGPQGKHTPLGFDYSDCLLMAECGLIEVADCRTIWMPATGFYLEYFGEGHYFRNPTSKNPRFLLSAGTFLWTKSGEELVRVAAGARNEAYLAAILAFHTQKGLVINRSRFIDQNTAEIFPKEDNGADV